MTVLVDKTIQSLIPNQISIHPFKFEQLGPSSYDFRLANDFMVFKNQVECIDTKNVEDIMESVHVADEDFFVLHPGQFALGGSIEKFTLADNIVGQVNGKSSLGRLGLQIHATAGFFDPGWDGIATMEFSNVAPIPIRLYPGMLIAQMVFMQGSDNAERPYGSESLRSKYQGATEAQASRYEGA